MRALLEDAPTDPKVPGAEPGSMLRALIRGVEGAHAARFPQLGRA